MKPTNTNGNGCDPMSSNCVVWQGPNIECIDLCKGDNISTVVAKLATELCNLIETFNIDNFDLSCFNLAECAPKDFKALINLLIEKICQDQGITTETVAGGCPDCEVNICAEFQYTGPTGDTVTTMQLKDYVLAIGNKLCTLVSQIGTIDDTLDSHNTRISNLEQASAPTVNLPSVTPTCVLPSTPQDLDVLLGAVEEEFCKLQNATGKDVDIITALNAACAGLNNQDRLAGNGTMSQIIGWNQTPNSLAQSFSNLWKTVCDLRSAVQFIQNNCCDTGCSSIDIVVDAVLNNPTELVLTFSGSIPNFYIDSPSATTITITDVSGGGPQVETSFALYNSYNLNQPYTIALNGVNGAADLNIKIDYSLLNTQDQSVCVNTIQTFVLGTDTCPDLNIIADYLGVNYSFSWNGTIPTSVIVQLWNANETVMHASSTLNITNNNPSGSFSGGAYWAEGTDYNLIIVINGTPCNAEGFTTLAYPCNAPTLNAPTLDYTDPEGAQDGKTIEGWQSIYDSFNP